RTSALGGTGGAAHRHRCAACRNHRPSCSCPLRNPLQFRFDEHVQFLHFLALAHGHKFLICCQIESKGSTASMQSFESRDLHVTSQATFRFALSNGQPCALDNLMGVAVEPQANIFSNHA